MYHTIEINVTAHDEEKLSESKLVVTHGVTLSVLPPIHVDFLKWQAIVEELVAVTGKALDEKITDAMLEGEA